MNSRVVHADWIAIILALGLVLAFNTITFAVLYDAIRSEGPGLSENATQVLTGLGGGIIGILGGLVGYRAGSAANNRHEPADTDIRELDPGDY